MSQALITESYLTDIANAIRSKTGRSATMLPSEMGDEIRSIQATEIEVVSGYVYGSTLYLIGGNLNT